VTTAGVEVDGQRFRPHVTLGRMNRPQELTSWVRLLDTYEGPPWRIEELALVASHLGEGPRGRAGSPKRPSLPDRWLESRSLAAAERDIVAAAEVDASGG
jgi:hypothetical protein